MIRVAILIVVVALTLAASGLGGCGQKGPLKLPEKPKPEAQP